MDDDRRPWRRPGPRWPWRPTGAQIVVAACLGAAAWLAACGGSEGPMESRDPPEEGPPELAEPPPDGTEAAATITRAALEARVGLLAADSMLGRWSPSPQLDQSAAYLAGELARAGLEPAGTADSEECGARGMEAAACPYLQWYFAAPEDAAKSPNVLARLPGADPQLRDRYVVIGAHFDHVGVGAAVAGDSIYNGADDNGSGTAAVIEIAEAFGTLASPPRRSIVFALFSAEERGLLGSRNYVNAPDTPMGGVSAMVNLDMIGRNWTDRVAAVFQPSSDIFDRASRVAESRPELGLDLLIDPWPDENLIHRSDQAPFLPYGVPVLFLTSGLHEDYHRPSDEAGRLDYEKTARVARLVFWILWELAEAEAEPGFVSGG